MADLLEQRRPWKSNLKWGSNSATSGSKDRQSGSATPRRIATQRALERQQQSKVPEYLQFHTSVFDRPSADREDNSVMLPSGKRVFVRCKTAEAMTRENDWKASQKELLNTDAYRRLAAETDELLKAVRASETDLNALQSRDVDFGVNSGNLGSKQVDTGLLASKHAPTEFMDLVSGERTNRDVLRWVKSWDAHVFNRPGPGSDSNKRGNGNKNNNNNNNTSNLDPNDLRPEQRVLLLAGPPGTGKTTLAQIIAKHVGYRVQLVNASDERTARSVQERVMAAMQMTNVFGDTRPTCLILDEIEGASNLGDGRGAIAMLVKMAQASLPSKASGANRGKQSQLAITRPLICVCNDAYAPVLRTLRPCSKLVHFRSPTTARLSQRLSEICQMERQIVRPGALDLLCDRMDHDIRSCLHALQFMANRSTVLTPQMVDRQCASAKDKAADLFGAWTAVFTAKDSKNSAMPRARAGARRGSAARGSDTKRVSRVESLHMQLSKFVSGSSKLLEGLHENVLLSRQSDSLLHNSARALDALALADELARFADTKQAWVIGAYVPWVGGVAIHLLCADTTSTPRIRFPRAQSETRQRQVQNAAVLDEISARLSVTRAVQARPREVALDLVTPALQMVLPAIRALPMSLLNNDEQARVRHAARAMLALGLQPQATTSEWQQSSWDKLVLSPPIEDLACSESAALAAANQLLESNQTGGQAGWVPREQYLRQQQQQQGHTRSHKEVPVAVAHELEIARARVGSVTAASGSRTVNTHSMVEGSARKRTDATQGGGDGTTKKTVAPPGLGLGLPQPQPAKRSLATARDFFGREIKVANTKRIRATAAAAAVTESSTGGDDAEKDVEMAKGCASKVGEREVAEMVATNKPVVVYQFNEGFSNAVKRSVLFSELV